MFNCIEGVENKIFHGINLKYYSNKLEDLKIFEEIIKSRKIMSRNDLIKMGYEHFECLPRIYEQCENEICFAMHPKNKNFSSVYCNDDSSSAFNEYIRFNISFVFLESILNNGYSLQDGGEIRIPTSLDMDKDLAAIGCFDEIEYLLEKVNRGKSKNVMFSEQLIKCEDIHKYISEKKKRTYIIKNLLKKYGYNVPIIDPLTGNIIDGNYEKNIEDVKMLKKILIKNI